MFMFNFLSIVKSGKFNFFCILILSATILILSSCTKKEVPVVVTYPVTNITGNSATCGGIVTDQGSDPVLERGICWSIYPVPTLDFDKAYYGSGLGSYKININDLKGATNYYVRAFAINEAGLVYGNTRNFRTLGNIPYAKTCMPTRVLTSAVTLNAEVNPNHLPIDIFFEYGETVNCNFSVPFLNNPVSGAIDTIISLDIEGLSQGTRYYFRVKAINSAGTVYGETLSFITMASDIEGNLYNIINIGDQFWMRENLKTTKYSDGTPIPMVTSDIDWAALATPAYCWYVNKVKYKDIYGGLYNWYAVETEKLCPTGWHVPSDDEWETLSEYLGGEDVAGGKLKEAGIEHWADPNVGATNESDFTALPGGSRRYDGLFSGLTGHGTWRTSTIYDETRVMYRYIFYHSPNLYGKPNNKIAGFSIRCIRD